MRNTASRETTSRARRGALHIDRRTTCSVAPRTGCVRLRRLSSQDAATITTPVDTVVSRFTGMPSTISRVSATIKAATPSRYATPARRASCFPSRHRPKRADDCACQCGQQNIENDKSDDRTNRHAPIRPKTTPLPPSERTWNLEPEARHVAAETENPLRRRVVAFPGEEETREEVRCGPAPRRVLVLRADQHAIGRISLHPQTRVLRHPAAPDELVRRGTFAPRRSGSN